jgi:flagellin-like protein
MVLKRLRRDRRGVSEVVGAVLIMGIVLAAAIGYLSYAMSQTSMQGSTIADLLKRARESQGQLFSIVYTYRDGSDIHLLIYNYGKIDVILGQAYVIGETDEEVAAVTVVPNFFERKTLVDAYFTNPLSHDPTQLLMVSKSGAVYLFDISVPG